MLKQDRDSTAGRGSVHCTLYTRTKKMMLGYIFLSHNLNHFQGWDDNTDYEAVAA